MHVVPASCPLSGKELECLQLLSDGMTYAEIGFTLGRSPSTVRSHLHSIYHKLDVANRAQAVLKATKEGWVNGFTDLYENQLLSALEQAISELCALLKKHAELTEQQRELLSAFDAVLFAHDDDEYFAARETMDCCVSDVARDAHIIIGKRRQRDLVDLLATYITNQHHINLPRRKQSTDFSRGVAAA